jgi:hypothetical protein
MFKTPTLLAPPLGRHNLNLLWTPSHQARQLRSPILQLKDRPSNRSLCIELQPPAITNAKYRNGRHSGQA